MTEKEIINTLRMAISKVEWKYPLDYTVVLEEAIKLIRLRIRQPLKELKNPNPIELGNDYAACPNCNSSINVILYQGAYCPNCGQHWEKYPKKLTDKNDGLPYCSGCGQTLDWNEE